jgi:hypothetical protein
LSYPAGGSIDFKKASCPNSKGRSNEFGIWSNDVLDVKESRRYVQTCVARESRVLRDNMGGSIGNGEHFFRWRGRLRVASLAGMILAQT